MTEMKKFVDGVVECNLISPFPKACKKRNPSRSEECKYCKYNLLNWDEGGFFPSFLEEKQYNPIKDKWTKFKYDTEINQFVKIK